MRWIVRFFKSVGDFLDHRFPERMTVEEVRLIMNEQDKSIVRLRDRVALLEDQHNRVVTQISAIKMMNGIKSAMAETE